MFQKVSAYNIPHLNSTECVDLDTLTQRHFKISSDPLMELASFQSSRIVINIFSPKIVCILCGKGNNGGDGFVLAKHLHLQGILPHVYLTEPKKNYRGILSNQLTMLESLNIPVKLLDESWLIEAPYDLIIDAMIGVGLKGSLRPEYVQLVTLLNKNKIPIISLDIPSGLHAEHPLNLDQVVRSTATITFGYPKKSFFEHHKLCGRVFLSYIGLLNEINGNSLSITKQLNGNSIIELEY